MLDYFTIAKRYYDLGIYGKEEVATFVQYGKITEEQYQEITSETYNVA
ncbi:phage uncharacterized protein, XkdX family [Schinkia azotoformans MEV2011]|uniref:Phage uncharacterized protein, XkdX family n=1 Tax=Schinkia azotoformans MEV2011 TaxID=1348973 RepID=A0A072NR35_SCHAZ|nr:XkdX family protein [Schinkia azotoformans]KEF40109.1 phage uncharacterized protein, XkdX family [Schinkia azotoformans MEV2011]